MMKETIISLLIVLSLIAESYSSLRELRFQVCTVEELRSHVEQFCIRHGRDDLSNPELGPYGTINGADSDRALIEILSYAKVERTHLPVASDNWKVKRDYTSAKDFIDTCCIESCVIKPEYLAPHCSSI